ncbi:hypothetical protein BDB01DRAFT_855154 [Pilobolus umbonatus]|nr:hypothetical protein BDB01DRAFT_855154 [Pilobolus umbonatus]
MLSIKHTLPKVYTQLCRPSIQNIIQTRWNSSTPDDTEDKKITTQFDGILNVLGQSRDTINFGNDTTSNALSESARKQKSNEGNMTYDLSAFTTTLSNIGQAPHQLHINATPNNTIITLTRPNGAPLVTTSGGSAGFKKAARSGYEAAHQAAVQLLDKMQAKNLQVNNIHIILKGFGPGRDAAFKALVSGSPDSQWNVKRITDATPIPFGGCRPKKARRL